MIYDLWAIYHSCPDPLQPRGQGYFTKQNLDSFKCKLVSGGFVLLLWCFSWLLLSSARGLSECFSCLSVSLNALLTLHFPCFTQCWVPADGLAALASDLPPWGHGHFLCAPLPFLLLTEALIPLAALCLPACPLPTMGNITLKSKLLPDEHLFFFSLFLFYQEIDKNLFF